jgi:hypothetical protein
MNNDGRKNVFRQGSMLAGMARVNARAYAAVMSTVLRERLWRVSPRAAPLPRFRFDGRGR